MKALMTLGVMKTATQPLTKEEVEVVTQLIESSPDDFEGGGSLKEDRPKPRGGPPRGRPPGGAGVREPRRPRPEGPSEDGAGLPKEDS